VRDAGVVRGRARTRRPQLRQLGRLLRPPRLESLFVGTFALLGIRLGAQPIGDNSAFVHLRTGLDIADGLGIPRRDPYSFTAAGEPWVVQSWLVDLLYGVVGLDWVVPLNGLLFGLLAWLMARLARAGSPLRTAAAAGMAVAIGAVYWTPRPLMVGLICLALVVTVVERRMAPWWLLPVAWVWVNSHGSFVLGLVWLGLVVAGASADRKELAVRELRALGVFAGGIVLGAVNPLGPRLLTFPLTLLRKREAFERVLEWRSPSFQDPSGLLLLVALMAAVVVIARHRPGWRDLMPASAFVGLGLLAQRNLPAAAVVLAPVLGRALATTASRDAARPPLHLAVAGVLGAAGLVFLVGAATGPAVDLDDYPVQELRALRGQRTVHDDVVGGYLILERGRAAGVFIDDRVDMYPSAVSADYRRLLDGDPESVAIVRRSGAEAAVWERDAPLVAQLEAAGWERTADDGQRWVVLTDRRR
jgi:hypothetical protein